MTKRITCATLIQYDDAILACHATGCSHWDLPKGVAEESEYGDEGLKEAACRELREETGIILQPEWLTLIQIAPYNEHKDIALFYHRLLCKIETHELHCYSTFVKGDLELPEVDAYHWMTLDKFIQVTSNVMRRYIETNQALIESYLTNCP